MRFFRTSETIGFVPREGLSFVVGWMPKDNYSDDTTQVHAFWIGRFCFGFATWDPRDE